MPSFLEEVSRQLIEKHQGHLADLTVVFPNHRSGLFFREILSRQVSEPGWLPRLLTFQEFIAELSSLRSPDKLTLIFMLYQIYAAESHSKETFDQFYFWGDLLVEDFNEIDKSLVRADDLFANLRDLKELDARYDYLTPEQRELIAQFWKGFNHQSGEGLSRPKQAFLTFWNVLYRVYDTFRTFLQQLGLGYEGMMTRTVAESVAQYANNNPFPRVAFVGFNAFYPAEEKVVSWFVRQAGADVLWDIDALYLEDPVQEAGMFFRKYRSRPGLGATFPKTLPQHFYGGLPRNIHMVGVTLEVGQAKLVGNTLQKLIKQGGFVPERTAIVLPDQNLLFPVLHALPPEIRRVNVTMGYPLRNTSLYSLIEQLLQLQEGKRQLAGRSYYEFHHASLLSVLRHPYVAPIDHEEIQRLIRRIEDENRIYVRAEELHRTPFLQMLFQPLAKVPETFTYLLQLLKTLHDHIAITPDSPKSNTLESHPTPNTQHLKPNDPEPDLILPVLEKELIYHLYIHVNRLKALAEENQFQFEQATFLKLFRQMMQSLRLPFTGEPLRGIQIMGVLETRNLDFDNVFILSANEGIYPPREVGHSFVPGNLRRGFGLPTPDFQDAIYAYTFYRLLHQAQNIYLLHNTEDTPTLSGEMSRFLYQLIYESEAQEDGTYRYPDAQGAFRIRRHTLSAPVRTIPPTPITIEKDAAVMERLNVYTQGGTSGLTPSALNKYLDCRLKFYYQYVAGLRESEGVQDEVDPAVFGNVLHKAMERVYQHYVERTQQTMITAEAMQQLGGKALERAVQAGFREHFRGRSEEFTLEGRNLIAHDMVLKMAKRILEMDAQYAPFEIVSLEREADVGYTTVLPVPVNETTVGVTLKGIIDRVDRKDGTVRVLDYKTGRDEKRIKSIDSLFDRDDPQRNKAAMQAMLYALLYASQATHADERITPGLVNAKELFGRDFDPRLILDKHPIDDFEPYQVEFTQALTRLLSELFDPHVPFSQTEDIKKCDYCPFVKLCY